jgi:hypothetical protein
MDRINGYNCITDGEACLKFRGSVRNFNSKIIFSEGLARIGDFYLDVVNCTTHFGYCIHWAAIINISRLY